jgi:hypothetical protein
MLASDLIYAAFRISGILKNAGRNFPLTGTNYAEGLTILQNMMDEWATERLTIYTVQMYTVALAAGQGGAVPYTIGPGGQFDLPWPSRIERASVQLISENAAAPIELEMSILTLYGWQNIPQKNIQSAFPLWLYYDGEFPLGNVYVWPIPTQINNLILYLWQVLSQPATLATELFLPFGYTNALEYCLAREFAIRWPERASMSQDAMMRAMETRDKIRALNVPILDLACDQALVNYGQGTWNWRTGSSSRQGF